MFEYYKHLDFVKLLTYATNRISIAKFFIDDDNSFTPIEDKEQKNKISKSEYFRKLLSYALFDQSNIYYNLNIIIPYDDIIARSEKKQRSVVYLSNLIDEILVPDRNLILFINNNEITETNKNVSYPKLVLFDYNLKALPSRYLLNVLALRKYFEYFTIGKLEEVNLTYNTIILTNNNQTSFSTHRHIVINPFEKDHFTNIGLLYHEVGHNILLHIEYSEITSQIFAKFLDIFRKKIERDFHGEIDNSRNPNTTIFNSILVISKSMKTKVDANSVRKSDILEMKYLLEILEKSAYNVLYNKNSTINVIYDVFVNYYAKQNGFPIMNIEEPVKGIIFGKLSDERNILENQIRQLISMDKYQLVINSMLYYTMPIELREKAYEILVDGLLNEIYNILQNKINIEIYNYYRRVMTNFLKQYSDEDNVFRRVRQFLMSGLAFDIANRVSENDFYFLHSLGDNSGILKTKSILENFFEFSFTSDKSIKHVSYFSDGEAEKRLRHLVVYIHNFPDLETSKTGKGLVGSHLVFRVFDMFNELTENEFWTIKWIKIKYLQMYYDEVIKKYIEYHVENIDKIFKEVDEIVKKFVEVNKNKFWLAKLNQLSYDNLVKEFEDFIKQNNITYIKDLYQFSIYHYLYFIEKMTNLQKNDFEIPKDIDFDKNFKIYLKIVDYLAELTKAFYNKDIDKTEELIKPEENEAYASMIYSKYYKKFKDAIYHSRRTNTEITKRTEYASKMTIALEIAYRRIIDNNRIDAFLFLFNSGVYLNWVIFFSF